MIYRADAASLQPQPIYAQAAQAVLGALGIAATPTNTALLVAWSWNEWGGTSDLALTNNPLADELPEPGSTDWNSAGVQVYPSLAVGGQATAATLRQFPTLVQALAGSDPAAFFSSAGLYDLAVWAGGPGEPNYGYAQQVQGNFEALGGQVAVASSGPLAVLTSPTAIGGGAIILGLLLIGFGEVEERRAA